MPKGHTISAAAKHVVHATDIGQGEIAAIGDMPVEIQIQRPDTQPNDGGGESGTGFRRGRRNNISRRRNHRFM